MTDRYGKIRQALAMRPTPGPWHWIGDSLTHRQFNIYAINGTDKHIATVNDLPVEKLWARDQVESEATARLIAACDSDTIQTLLDECDALRGEVAEWKGIAAAQAELHDEAEECAERLAEALAGLITWIPSADTYRRLGFDPAAPMRALERAQRALGRGGLREVTS